LDNPGGYAEFTKIQAKYVHRIPDNFSDIEAAPLLCAGVIGYRSLKLSQIQPGKNLGLYGFGASAHIVIQVARYWQCADYVFTRSEKHKDLARKLGARWVGEAPPEPMDSSIIFAPSGKLIPLALKSLKAGGTLAINAIHMSPIPEFSYDLLWQERNITSIANVTSQDGREFLYLAAKIGIRTAVEIFSLGEANRALNLLKKSELQGAGVLRIQ
jgi:propanol-preferring alcohol dehydrogenase